MWPYFVIAVAASAVVGAGIFLEKRAPSKYRRLATVAAYVFAGAIFCFFAGARDYSVGADVATYGGPSYDMALELGFTDFFSSSPYSTWDPLTKIVLWASANATHSFFWYLFVIELFFVAPTLIAIRLLLKDSGFLGVFVFGILFFPMSLNLMRQAMAIGFVLLSFVFIRSHRPALFALFILMATLFHDTALMAVLIYPLFLMGSWDKGSLPIKLAIMTAAIAVLIAIMPIVFDLLSPYLGHYGTYTNGSYAKSLGALKIAVASVLLFVGLGAVYCYCQHKSNPKAKRSSELLGIALIVFFGAIITAAGLIGAPLYRLGLYFMVFSVLLVPMAIDGIKTRPPKTIFETASLVGLSAYSIGYYVLGSNIQVVMPYLLA